MDNGRASRRGQLLIQTLVLSALSVVFIGVLTNLAVFNVDIAKRSYYSEVAFQTAEAGIEYYRWHLAHAPDDFEDGTGGPGPYVHEFKDKELVRIGQFSLDITPPPSGSTLVTILSTATVDADPSAVRKIRVRLAIPSFTKYAVAANDDLRFGEGTDVFGPIYANGGIHFDGTAHNLVSSAKDAYNDPDHEGGNEFGVHTHRRAPPQTGIDLNFQAGEAPPTIPVPVRGDVFLSGRQFPVPAIDFVGLSADLADLKTDVQQGNGRYFAPSSGLGYHLVLKTNDTFDVYTVTATTPVPNGCTSVQGQQGWGTWSIQDETILQSNQQFPSSGLLFFEDNLWVNGQINTARLSIAAARFPDTPGQRKSITVNNDLLYTNYDGQDVIALIAQGNFNVGLVSEDDLRIDAALVAQNGRAGRYYYRPPTPPNQDRCSPYHIRQVITLYGSIVTNQRYGFAYTDGTGYQTRNIIYDQNLAYAPPPNFPLVSDEYELISWEEVR